MSSKDSIIANIRKSLATRENVDYPEIPHFSKNEDNYKNEFKTSLEEAGGKYYKVDSILEAQRIISTNLPNAEIFCSSCTEWKGNRDLNLVQNPEELHDVDVGIFRAKFGVAETGMIWVTQEDLIINSLGFLAQHLVVLLDPEEIVENMHFAYDRVQLNKHPYGTFMMGPSATADIEAVLVHGAQGARTFTVFLLDKP